MTTSAPELGRSPFLARGHVPYVIAEAGVNHDGDTATAHALVDLAARCGADAVKFQTFDTDLLVAASALAAPYQARATAAVGQREMLERLTLPEAAWADLRRHALDAGLDFLSTPFDTRSADMLVSLGMSAVKVGSGEVTNLPFLRHLATLGLPVVLSTGMSDSDEVDAAVHTLERAPSTSLLHCVSAYPAPPAEANLRVIPVLAARYGLAVGWSDHTTDDVTALVATALGAVILERHVTVDRSRPGPDHAASSDEAQFSSYVTRVRLAAAALGDGVKAPAPSERENMGPARRSWHALRDLPAGHRITDGDVAPLRPATGISPAEVVAGRTLREPLPAGHALTHDHLVPR